jgi:hypothetical protein
MSCIFLAEVTGAGASFFSTSTVNFALGYWAGSIATTMLLTGFIVGKLLYIRSQLRGALGAEFDRRSPYVTISAMLVESACLYSACALAFIILFARNDPFQNIFLPILGQVQVCLAFLTTCKLWPNPCRSSRRSSSSYASRRDVVSRRSLSTKRPRSRSHHARHARQSQSSSRWTSCAPAQIHRPPLRRKLRPMCTRTAL